MTHATRRGIKRSSLAGRARKSLPTLASIAQRLDADKRSYGLYGRFRGARVLTFMSGNMAAATMTFRHPTKRATAGRYAFLTTSGTSAEFALTRSAA